MIECFVGLGGNIGESFEVISGAIHAIASLEEVFAVRASRPFLTTPVSAIPQPLYLNAVVSFQTCYSPHKLFALLEEIEVAKGKKKKSKEEKRIIDLDLL